MAEGQRTLLFGWIDYLAFGLTLSASALIGVYYAWRGVNSTSEYLMGGKQMKILPVAISISASAISSTALLGVPTDIYLTGAMFFWQVVGISLSVPAASYLHLSVLYRLKVVSANQYLELRFNSLIRRLTSLLYIFQTLFYMAIVAYGPSLAFRQVSGFDVYVCMAIIISVCTLYTFLGGIKAVVWTDTLQMFIMFGSVITVMVIGIVDVGGIDVVWQRNRNSSRLEFWNMDLNPTVRHTLWSTTIGKFFYWTATASSNQTFVQRFLSMPNLRKARLSMWIHAGVSTSIVLLCCLTGLVIYAKYFDCDPITSKIIEKPDQIVPLYVIETVGRFPGLTGLYIAGVFSGSLSSLSSGLNAIGLIVLEDFVRPFRPGMSDFSATRWTKVIIVIFAVLIAGTVFIVSSVKTLSDATLSLNSAMTAGQFGVFTLGMLVPWANSYGAVAGLFSGFGSIMLLGVSAQVAKARGMTHNQMKPLSIENCPVSLMGASNFTTGLMKPPNKDDEEFLAVLKLSYLWYMLFGTIIALIVGSLVSILTKRTTREVDDPSLFFPFIAKYVQKRKTLRKDDTLTEIPLLNQAAS